MYILDKSAHKALSQNRQIWLTDQARPVPPELTVLQKQHVEHEATFVQLLKGQSETLYNATVMLE